MRKEADIVSVISKKVKKIPGIVKFLKKKVEALMKNQYFLEDQITLNLELIVINI